MKLPSFLSDFPVVQPDSCAHAVRRALVAACLLAVAAPLQSALAESETERGTVTGYPLDWVPFDQLTDEQQRATRGICRGAYVHPPMPEQQPGADSNEISAREASYDENGEVLLQGEVRALTPNGLLQADQARLSADRSRMQVEGNVSIRQPAGLMQGRSGWLNNQQQTFDIEQADYLIFQNEFRGAAGRIRRTEEGLVVIEDGSYTSCHPGDNSWQLVGSEIELDSVSGFGTAKHARLELADIPVFYWPYFKFPIDDRRHTGLLMPTLGIGSEGLEHYKQPLYLNLAPNYDATLTPHWYRERGTHMGTEWRYLLADDHYGMLTYDFLQADSLYNNEDRNLFAYEARGTLAPNWIYRIDYAKASDDDYFRSFEANFDDANTEKLDQLAETRYRTGNWQLAARVQGFQELDAGLTDARREYYKLPELEADYASRSGNLSWGSRNDTVWFSREVEDGSAPVKNRRWGADLEAQRSHIEPFMRYRADAIWGFSQLDLRAAYSQYQLTGQPDSVAEPDARMVPTLALDSGLFFERDFSLFSNAYIQTLEPRIKLVYAPTEDQSDIPVFDTSEYAFDRNQLFRDTRFSGIDRQGDLQKLALGVTSRFISESSGRELVNLSVGQAFYAKERTVTLSTNPDYQPGYQHTREVSPLVAALGYYPLDWLSLDLSTQWNTDTSGLLLEKREARLTANHDSGLAFLLRYSKNYTGCVLSQTCDEGDEITYNETADLGVIAPLGNQWRAFAVARQDLVADQNLERIAGVEYESCCWAVRVARHEFYTGNDYDNPEAQDDNIRVELVLKGFGGIGEQEPYERAAEFIPGFRAGY